MGRLFGTDGVRGVANTELTAELAYRLGQAGAYELTAETHHTPDILVGTDTRISCQMLEAALIAGICSVGARAVRLGVIPTPAVAHLTRLYKADAGVVISASHNPFEFNGIKFFDGRGYKLPDALEDRIEDYLIGKDKIINFPTGASVGTVVIRENADADYEGFLTNLLKIDLKGKKIALDCANGAAYKIAPAVFEKLGAEAFVINNKPDGININKNCGSTHIGALRDFTVKCGAAAGFAFDGDADRVIAVDEQGGIVDGDQIMAVIGVAMKKGGGLPGNTIVATVMSNLGLEVLAKNEGIRLLRTKVGDRYVLEEMLAGGYQLGGEQSGHIIFLQHNSTGDGILTSLQLMNAVQNTGKPLSLLAGAMKVMPQILKNVKISAGGRDKYKTDEMICARCKEVEEELGDSGRLFIRASGTEPLIRIMLEGSDEGIIKQRAEELARLFAERLG
ncbi:MAG: phosphoglucosamine mutase [Clostridiales bacterium]|nr:phosphoglucosamine mutase [Clostridiales bacterium]